MHSFPVMSYTEGAITQFSNEFMNLNEIFLLQQSPNLRSLAS